MSNRSFVVYRSSAGSGKTFTLVKEYLRLALDDAHTPPSRYRSVNAITFTNKASAEMKERILLTLRRMQEGHPGAEVLTMMLEKELGLPQTILRQRVGVLLNSILHHYSDFSISTIDSFTHRVIRTFAHDLHLPQQFELSTDRNHLVRQAVDILLDRSGKEDKVTNYLLEFMKNHMEEERNWNVRDTLIDATIRILKTEDRVRGEELSIPEEGALRELKKKLFAEMQSFRSKTHQLAAGILEQLKRGGLSVSELSFGQRGIGGWLQTMSAWSGALPDINQNAVKAITGEQWTAKANKEAEAKMTPLLGNCTAAARTLLDLIEKEGGDFTVRRIVAQHLDVMVLFRDIRSRMEEYRKENDLLLIGDLNKLIAQVVRQQPAPFIYERLGTRFRHYLIDEFQDTSGLQWTNLLPLLHQSLSEGNFNMVVGDGKQAIYRFRGGEVRQFTGLPAIDMDAGDEIMGERAGAIQRNFREARLGTNYRSGGAIVQFNNELYQWLVRESTGTEQEVFRNARQEWNGDDQEGYVEIAFPETKDSHPEQALDIIRRMQSNGFEFRDIALLTRDNKDAAEIAHFMQHSGIPVISSDSLLISASPEVRFILNLLRAVNGDLSPAGNTALIEYVLRKEEKKITLQSLRAAPSFLSETDLETYRNISLTEITESVIRKWNLQPLPDPYITTFCDLVLAYTTHKGNDPGGFLEWWEERSGKEYVHVPEGLNAVRVMTIHKSKGLEFPVVILPRCNWDTQKLPELTVADISPVAGGKHYSMAIPLSKALENTFLQPILSEELEKARLDNLNLLYVATTRAASALFMLCERKHKAKEVSAWVLEWLVSRGYSSDHEEVFRTGRLAPHDNTGHRKDITATLEKTHSASWRERLQLRRRYREQALPGFNSSARNKGIVIHHALAQMACSSDTDHATEVLLRKGLIVPGDKEAVTAELRRIMQNKKIRNLFDQGKPLMEREVLLPDGEFIRPDRIQFLNAETHVIDFKTGMPREEHAAQVRHYGSVLAEAGYPGIKSWLIYTDSGELMTC
ncbi:MAG: UvrD-helicase domain-containing protein [Bacteroidia bacterium]|nr:UvrD-helicase domain-containing protein [Bacteroidia bacterium]